MLAIPGSRRIWCIIIPLFIGAAIISLPSLGISASLISLLPFRKVSTLFNLFVWLLLLLISIVINLLLIAGLFGDLSVLATEQSFLLPVLIAGLLSVLIRYWQFHDLMIARRKEYEYQLEISRQLSSD
jgi:pilus assembly protein TadC